MVYDVTACGVCVSLYFLFAKKNKLNKLHKHTQQQTHTNICTHKWIKTRYMLPFNKKRLDLFHLYTFISGQAWHVCAYLSLE
jgi:hypothetical protein